MRRRIFIAAPNRPDLLRYAHAEFANDPSIEVIVDRRAADRRRRQREPAPDAERGPAPDAERRRKERRAREYLDRHLAMVGYAVAFLD
jgi:hypothetical protein